MHGVTWDKSQSDPVRKLPWPATSAILYVHVAYVASQDSNLVQPFIDNLTFSLASLCFYESVSICNSEWGYSPL